MGSEVDIWALVHDDQMVRDVFPLSARDAKDPLLLFFIPYMAMISRVECDGPSKLFWYRDQVFIWP